MDTPVPPFQTDAVANRFAAMPDDLRPGLLRLRHLIFDVAADTDGVGPLEESLRWGQPAYLTSETRSGTTLRLGISKTGQLALFVHCQTRLIDDFRNLFPGTFSYDKTRAIHLDPATPLPETPLRLFIRNALTYHRSPR